MATRGIENQTTGSLKKKGAEAKEVGGGKKRKISSSDGSETQQPAPKKTKKTITTTVVEETSPKEQKPPRALLAMYKQVLSHPDYTLVIDKANPNIITELASRYKNNGPEGTEVFESSRKHNRLLRCVWKFLHHKDPVLLEEAIQLVTPKPKKVPVKKAAPADTEDGDPEDDGEEEEEDDE